MIFFFVVRYRIYWMLLAAHVALYADSWHFVMPPLVSLQKDVWETDAEIPHWWHVTTQIWVVLLIGWKFASTNQSEALLRSGQWRIISIKFLQSFLRHHFEEPEVTWQNGGCFVRPLSQVIKTSWKIQKMFFSPPASQTQMVTVQRSNVSKWPSLGHGFHEEYSLFYCSLFIMQILLSLLRSMAQYTRYYQMKWSRILFLLFF